MANVKVSIEINQTDQSGKIVTDKVAYVNPTATDEQLRTFAQKLSNLTNNTYQSTTKITEEKI